MNKLKLGLCTLIFNLTMQNTFSQALKFHCPMKGGTIEVNKNNYSKEIINPKKTIIIKGRDTKIFSVSKGKVASIKEVDSMYVIIVNYSEYKIVYENLDLVYVSKNQDLQSGQILGKSFSNMIELSIYKNQDLVSNPKTLLNCKCVK